MTCNIRGAMFSRLLACSAALAAAGCGSGAMGPATETPVPDQAHIQAQMKKSMEMGRHRGKMPANMPGAPAAKK